MAVCVKETIAIGACLSVALHCKCHLAQLHEWKQIQDVMSRNTNRPSLLNRVKCFHSALAHCTAFSNCRASDLSRWLFQQNLKYSSIKKDPVEQRGVERPLLKILLIDFEIRSNWRPSCLIRFRLALSYITKAFTNGQTHWSNKARGATRIAARRKASEPEERLWVASASTENNHKWQCPQTPGSSWLVSLGEIMRSATYPRVYWQLNTAQLAMQILLLGYFLNRTRVRIIPHRVKR